MRASTEVTLVLIRRQRAELSFSYRKISLGTRIQQWRREKIQESEKQSSTALFGTPKASTILRHLKMPQRPALGTWGTRTQSPLILNTAVAGTRGTIRAVMPVLEPELWDLTGTGKLSTPYPSLPPFYLLLLHSSVPEQCQLTTVLATRADSWPLLSTTVANIILPPFPIFFKAQSCFISNLAEVHMEKAD